jgi:Tol biopolymer transport system component
VIEEDGTIRTVTTGTQVPSNLTYRTGGELYYEASLQATSGATGISSTTSIDAVATDGGNQRTAVYERGATYHPAWSPDGERLAYVSSRPRAACGAEGQERQRCDQPLVVRTGERSVDVVDRGIAANPAWSPDGERIAFSWRKDRRLAIWLVEPGGQPVRVTEGRGEDEPTWSPDGRSIAFTRDCDVWVQEVEGGVARNVTTTPDICEISPAWRPGGER